MKDGAVTLTGKKGSAYKGDAKASYTPSAPANPYIGGKDGSTNYLGQIPEVQVGGSFEVGTLPKIGGGFSVGENKNVSTPVSGS